MDMLEHWRLKHWPFRPARGADCFYPSPTHEEALARIGYLVEARRRTGLLLGESGVGKSLVLRQAARQLDRQGRTVAVVDAAGVSPREFLWQTAAAFGTAPRDADDALRLWRQVADYVAQNGWQRIDTVLMVDDAGQAGPEVVMLLSRLARLEPTPDARWTILLAAEPDQAARWHESLRELADLRIDLRPWSEEDTVGFVQTALVDAGRFEPVFDDEALAVLHKLSGGVPRRVVRLADLALLEGALAGKSSIDAATVRAGQKQSTWTPSAPESPPFTPPPHTAPPSAAPSSFQPAAR
jgi:type II secretory pathway predicted ATPase ExeA